MNIASKKNEFKMRLIQLFLLLFSLQSIFAVTPNTWASKISHKISQASGESFKKWAKNNKALITTLTGLGLGIIAIYMIWNKKHGTETQKKKPEGPTQDLSTSQVNKKEKTREEILLPHTKVEQNATQAKIIEETIKIPKKLTPQEKLVREKKIMEHYSINTNENLFFRYHSNYITTKEQFEKYLLENSSNNSLNIAYVKIKSDPLLSMPAPYKNYYQNLDPEKEWKSFLEWHNNSLHEYAPEIPENNTNILLPFDEIEVHDKYSFLYLYKIQMVKILRKYDLISNDSESKIINSIYSNLRDYLIPLYDETSDRTIYPLYGNATGHCELNILNDREKKQLAH